VIGERGVRISGGERQRLSVARALYRDPAVLVFDEATSSLDGETERDLTLALRQLRGHKTIIIVTHRPSSLEACDQIVHIAEGRMTTDDARNGMPTP
jgi:ATP-binding cassette, subfamily B, bacterial PglK